MQNDLTDTIVVDDSGVAGTTESDYDLKYASRNI